MNNKINNEENKRFIFKVGIIALAVIVVILIVAGIFAGIIYFFIGKADLNQKIKAYEIYDSEIYAKKYGDKIVKELVLGYGRDINATDENNIGGLYQAIKMDNIKAVKFLIENNANIEIDTYDGTSPLILAIEENKPKIAELLIENGADINYKNEDGTTILYNAVLSLNLESVNYLLEKNASVENAGISEIYGNIIMAAAGSKFNNFYDISPVDLKLVESYSQNSAKIMETIIKKADKNSINYSLNGKTPLIIAVGNSYIDTVKILIENKADVNKRDNDGWSALTYAVNNGDIEIAKILLENKAIVNDEVLIAVKSPILESRIDMIKLLIDNGADINYTDDDEFTPLNIAIESGDIKFTKFLITNGANVNGLMPYGGVNLIEYAISENNMDLLQILIENGADIDNTEGDSTLATPLMTASMLGLDNVVRILLSRNANINAVDMNGDTALHFAARNSQLSVIRILLDKKPDLDIQNDDGNTALHLAVISGNIDVVSEIVLSGANTRIRNYERKYPMDIARANNSAAIFEVLREAETLLLE